MLTSVTNITLKCNKKYESFENRLSIIPVLNYNRIFVVRIFTKDLTLKEKFVLKLLKKYCSKNLK